MMVEAMAQQTAAFQANQERLVAMLVRDRAPREDKAPIYNVSTLTEDMLPPQAEDWIRGIEDGNGGRPKAKDLDKIRWALTKVAADLQTKWRSHSAALESAAVQEGLFVEYEGPIWKDFLDFVRKAHLDPELQIRHTREQLFRAY
jgi:hypothetical protein